MTARRILTLTADLEGSIEYILNNFCCLKATLRSIQLVHGSASYRSPGRQHRLLTRIITIIYLKRWVLGQSSISVVQWSELRLLNLKCHKFNSQRPEENLQNHVLYKQFHQEYYGNNKYLIFKTTPTNSGCKIVE